MPSAGEVEQFGYCAHNWWLSRQGIDAQTEGSRKANAELERIAATFHEAARYRRRALEGLQWSFRIMGVAAAATLVTIATVTFQTTPLSFALIAASLVVLNCSAGLLTIALYADKKAKQIQAQTGLAPEPLPDGKILRDPAWDLSGRVDYVLHAGDKAIPMLVKSARTPHHAYPNHELHLAAEMRLLEANGTRPEYGLVTYPEGVFRVDWNDATQTRLKLVLERMEAAVVAGKADRDHNDPHLCKSCARRDACDQRLA